MENFLENTFKNFNQSIMEIDWYSNIGNLNTNNNLILINDYLCSINKNANISLIKNWQEATVLINSKNFDNDIWEKDFPSFITIPSNPPSLIKVFDPAPSTLILFVGFKFFKNIDNSFKLFGLNITFAGPPKLNHE